MKTAPSRAFSLVELLAVMAIISTLAALLLPVVVGSAERARSAVCLANQRQTAQAFALYVADYDNTYPPASSGSGNWVTLLHSHLAIPGALICPDRILASGFTASSEGGTLTGHAYNANLAGVRLFAMTGTPEPAVRYPATTVLIFAARAGILRTRGPTWART